MKLMTEGATCVEMVPVEPYDTAKHGAPDPEWSLAVQLQWYSRYSHILLLNSSERLRQSAAAQADRAVGKASR